MLPSERQNRIIEILEEQDLFTIKDIINQFEISIETVRRDLNTLEKQGKIEKVYGGVRLKKVSNCEPELSIRFISNIHLKEAIGKKCSELIEDGDSLYIDSGTTTFQITKFIKEKKNLTIFTNSLPVLNELSNTDFNLLLIGGMYRKAEQSIVTYASLFNFSNVNIKKAFFCAGGISLENGISDFNFHEVETKKELLNRAQEVFIAIDSTKFNQDVVFNFSSLSKIDYIVTDERLNDDTRNLFAKKNVNLIISKI